MAKPKRVNPNALTVDKVNDMWEAYQKKQTGRYVSRECGVTLRTAMKYIKEGDQSRGMKPFRDRFAGIQQKIQDKKDDALARARSEGLKITRAYKAKIVDALKKKKVDPDNLSVSDVDGIIRLEMMIAKDEQSEESRQLVFSEAPQYPPELVMQIAHMLVHYQQTGKSPTLPVIDAEFNVGQDVNPGSIKQIENAIEAEEAQAANDKGKDKD